MLAWSAPGNFCTIFATVNVELFQNKNAIKINIRKTLYQWYLSPLLICIRPRLVHISYLRDAEERGWWRRDKGSISHIYLSPEGTGVGGAKQDRRGKGEKSYRRLGGWERPCPGWPWFWPWPWLWLCCDAQEACLCSRSALPLKEALCLSQKTFSEWTLQASGLHVGGLS